VYKTLDCTRVLTERQNTGITFTSAGGNPDFAFDGNFATACTQTAPNGYIGIDITTATAQPSPTQIKYVGVLSNVDRQYRLIVECSDDGLQWFPAYTMQRPQMFSGLKNAEYIVWFPIINPLNKTQWRIRELDGATLDICEIYLEKFMQSIYIAPISQDSFDALSFKTEVGLPTTYSILKKANQMYVFIWATPDSSNIQQTTLLDFRTLKYPFDINYLFYPIEIDQKYLKALRCNLTYELARIWNPAQANEFLNDFNVAMKEANKNDADIGPLNFNYPMFFW
jgi:hypothetical protein